jgi:hypothetical protein
MLQGVERLLELLTEVAVVAILTQKHISMP